MSPYETAVEWYRSHEQPFTFSHYLIENALHGFVFITPSFFIMGHPACKAHLEGTASELGNAAYSGALVVKHDTWKVVFCCGNLSKAWSILPYHLPYIAFERDRDGRLELQIFPIERIQKLSSLAT